MKRFMVLLCGFLVCTGLSACAGGSRSKGDKYWSEARKAEDFGTYVTQNWTDFDLEALKQEFDSADSTQSQKFKAAALLCAREYQNKRAVDSEDSWTKGAFSVDYPESAQYAAQCLSMVAEGEAFQESFEDAFWPHDYFWPILAAAEDLDGQTVTALWTVDSEVSYGDKLKEAVEQWVEANPKAIITAGDALMEAGFYEDWGYQDWNRIYLNDYSDAVEADSLQEALDYIIYMQKVLPELEEESSTLRVESKVNGESYYNTKLMVAVENGPELKEGAGDTLLESIELEGKKVIALYRNLQSEEFEDSPAPLQVMGDFMFGLSAGEMPSAAEEADYYLVLTPNYEYGDFYQSDGGSETKIQEVRSSTSIDLFEAATGNLLCHVGNILENAPSRIFTSYDDESAQFPEVTGADVLSYIYHNIGTPDLYVALLDNLTGKSQLEKEESVIVGDWEITYHSGELTDGFTHGIYAYEPGDGNVFAKGYFTITNKSTENAGFLPMIYTIGEDTVIELVDNSTGEVYECVDLLSYGKCLNGSYLDPGESEDGELFFQIPDGIDAANLSFAVSLGNQVVYYPF